MKRDIWHLLVDERGDPAFEDVGADKVTVSTEVDVADFRKKVWKKNQRIIEGVSAQLKVFSNKDDISNSTKALEVNAFVTGMGENKRTALFVVVPKKKSEWLQLNSMEWELPSRSDPSGPVQSIASGSMEVNVKWKDEERIIYSLDKDSLYFVNRTDAIEQLHKIHRSKFHRAVSRAGADWIIPIVDNVVGLGKSGFARHYIRKSRERWPDETRRDNFQKTLCDCHTIAIEFPREAFERDSFDSVILKYLRKALEPMFITPPSMMLNNYNHVDDFLVDLTKHAGPVFIVLDNIGQAFERQFDPFDDFQQRDKFLLFCECILDSWFSLKNVFFVVLGRASYLSLVGPRPVAVQNMKPSQYVFKRLDIHLLQPSSICVIMDNTLISSPGTATISSRLGLTPQNSQAVAEHLFHQTNGHPRSLVDAFQNCSSVGEILEYVQPLTIPDWKSFYDKLNLNKREVMNLLKDAESCTAVNLARTVVDSGGKIITLENIASNSFFAWEGTLLEARLYVQPIVREYMENYVLPFRAYLKYVGSVTRVAIDYSSVFEWMFLRRFQEIFSQAPKEPRLAAPEFFDTPEFGNYKSVLFSTFVRPMPKITSAGLSLASLDSNTAHPDCWPQLLNDLTSAGPVCLKPLTKSASCDCFLIGTAMSGEESVVLTVGLSVKNYGTTEFSWNHLSRECFVFNRMFDGTDCTVRRNILFICCTHYSSEIMSEFNGGCVFVYDSKSYPNIDEVVLLNLCDKQNRKRFFDVGDDLSVFVENVVDKAEVEYFDVF